MDRRGFLKKLGIGVAVAVSAPIAVELSRAAHLEDHFPFDSESAMFSLKSEPVIGGYAEYTNFSSHVFNSEIDEVVARAAKELGEAAARDINEEINRW